MKDMIFGVLQRVGRSFMLPIAILPIAGLFLGLGATFTNPLTLESFGLANIMGEGTVIWSLFLIMTKVGNVIFANLPLLFAVGVAIGMAEAEKETAAFSAMIAFLTMHITCSAILTFQGNLLADGSIAAGLPSGMITSVLGIKSLEMGVFGGIITGLGTAFLHNRYRKTVLPDVLAFFGGSHFVPIISTAAFMVVGLIMTLVWPGVQNLIITLGKQFTEAGCIGVFGYAVIHRLLIPFGLHHVFYTPFWFTALGGTMTVDGIEYQGAQMIILAQLASPGTVHFSAEATKFFTGFYPLMMFAYPAAALAMYHTVPPARRKEVVGILFSAAFTSILTGITEPIEFPILFASPILFAASAVMAGISNAVMYVLNITIGYSFSSGLLDFILFGVMQGNSKTNWIMMLPIGAVYFAVYYFGFRYCIEKFDLKTPGRENETTVARMEKDSDNVSGEIIKALGGKDNLVTLDCCATRLRLAVKDPSLVDKTALKATGAVGTLIKGENVQIVYGVKVNLIKAALEEYLAKC